MGFNPQDNFKMLHINRGELNQLYDTFCRVWAAGGQASLTTSSLAGMVTAKLEVQLGQPTDARPGAPPPHLRHASSFASTSSAAPAPGATRRPCHRGPAAKAKARARAATHQAVKAAASTASGGAPPLSSPSGGAPPSVAARPSGGAPPLSPASGAHLPLASPSASGLCLANEQQRRVDLQAEEERDIFLEEPEDDNDYFNISVGEMTNVSPAPQLHPPIGLKRPRFATKTFATWLPTVAD